MRRDGIVVRRCLITGRGRADDETLGVGGGQIIGAGLRIGIVAVERMLPGERPIEISLPAGRLMQRQRGADHRREVGCEAGKFQLALAPGMTEPVAARHRAGDEVEGAFGQFAP